MARNGGIVRAYRYPRLDSLVWKSSEPAPALAAILAFDQEDGMLAYLAKSGAPGWIDLRVGTARPATRVALASITTSDAWSLYGIRRDSSVQRLTPSGDWSLSVAGAISRLFPLPDGSLLVMARRGDATRLLRFRPPESNLIDSVTVPEATQAAVSPIGDRVFLAANGELLAVGAQTLRILTRLRLEDEVAAMVPTPSGDRLFVAFKNRNELAIIDRYSNERSGTVRLPGLATELRMDPLGRILLARPAIGDTAWVIGVATNNVEDRIPTQWRADLPMVASDGAVATVQGTDVVFEIPGEPRPRIQVRAGAGEIWHFVFWNGFRPRAKELDLPVVFPEESLPPVAAPMAARDTVPIPRVTRVDSAPHRVAPPSAVDSTPRTAPARDRDGWTVSFAAVLSDDRAREVAREIRVDGQAARVVVTVTEGVRIHRVVLGPYPSRSEADRVGRASGRSYWVFEGPP